MKASESKHLIDTYPSLYEVTKNRATGSHTAVLDLRPEGKYALVCLTHTCAVNRPKRLEAESEAHVPATWCRRCATAAKAKEKAA